MCANGKYSLYSHGRVVRAPWPDTGVSVRMIGCRPVEAGKQSVCSAAGAVGWRWGHTLPQEARLWHAVITVSFTEHERETEGGKAGMMEPTIIWHSVPHIFTLCLWNWGQAGLLFWVWGPFCRKPSWLWQSTGAFFWTFYSPQINSGRSNILLPVSCHSFGQCVHNKMTFNCSQLTFLKQFL